MRAKIILFILVGFVAACMPQVPPNPNVQVVVTVVDENLMQAAVAEALEGTASSGVAMTETALAVAGVTLTPTSSPTVTATPLPPTETPFVSPTPSLTPSATASPSITPYPSNTPSSEVEPVNGQIRVVHAWRSDESLPVDVFVDELPIAFDLATGQSTPYFDVGGVRTVRLLLVPKDGLAAEDDEPLPPVVNQLVEVPEGSSITAVLTDTGDGPQALVVSEDISPLATGQSRITVVHANPGLIRVDALEPVQEVALARDVALGEFIGPFDMPAGRLVMQFVDTEFPDEILVSPVEFSLASNVNYLVVMAPGPRFDEDPFSTVMLVFQSATRLTMTDTPIRFVNASPAAGPITVLVNGSPMAINLPVGEATVPLPTSREMSNLVVLDAQDQPLLVAQLGPWTPEQANLDKILVISDIQAPEGIDLVETHLFVRESNSSPALANIRLIHSLTGATQTLDLEIRATDPRSISNPIGVPQTAEIDQGWSTIVRNLGFGEVSDYVARASNIFDMRVVLSTSGGVQATLERQALLPGGAYDLLAVPGTGVGVTRLLMLEPNPQATILGSRRGDPQVVEAIVNATLTAVAPAETVTVAAQGSPTPTISPVPTNTPRATNTPRVKTPAIEVNPAPPEAVSGSFILFGENFTPSARYTVNIDNGPDLFSGMVSVEGEVALTVELPFDTAPGPHVVRVCVDCRTGGANEAALTAFIVADPLITPSPTSQP